MLEVYDKIMGIILPTLGAERQATYSPFLPVCPRTGKVLQVPMVERNVSEGTVVYVDPETNEKVKVPVTGGAVKCQWKADWAMRWAALDVAYEMSGKDLIDSVKLSTKICPCHRASHSLKACPTSCSLMIKAPRFPSRKATA